MEKASYLVLTFLLNAVWQIMAVAVAAAVCAWLLRHAQARFRHLLWVAALVLSIGLPVWSDCNFWGNRPLSFLQLPIKRIETQAITVLANEEIIAWSENSARREWSNPSNAPTMSALLIVSYALFFLYRVVRLWQVLRATKGVRLSSRVLSMPQPVSAVAEKCRLALRISNFSILFSSKATSPATLGARNPVIILPTEFLKIESEAMLVTALGHEMAHIRRQDFALNLACELLYLPISFHPAAIWMKRQIARDREMACDEMVTRHLIEPVRYVQSLLQIAKSALPPRHHAYTLGVFDTDTLEARIMKLIKTNHSISARAGSATFFIAMLLLGVTGIGASALSFSPRGHERSVNPTTAQNNIIVAQNLVGIWKGKLPEPEIPSEAEISPPPEPALSTDSNRRTEGAFEAEVLTLNLRMDGDRLTGTVVREAMFRTDTGIKMVRENEFSIRDVELDGNTLSFKFTEDVGDEMMFNAEMTLVSGSEWELVLTGESKQDEISLRMERSN